MYTVYKEPEYERSGRKPKGTREENRFNKNQRATCGRDCDGSLDFFVGVCRECLRFVCVRFVCWSMNAPGFMYYRKRCGIST